MPQPSRLDVEVFSDAVNAWIVRTPGRQFPGVIVQGDSLSVLFELAQDIVDGCRAVDPDSGLTAAAEELRDQLWARLDGYEQVLHVHGMPLPYNRKAWPK